MILEELQRGRRRERGGEQTQWNDLLAPHTLLNWAGKGGRRALVTSTIFGEGKEFPASGW